ncbi:MAG: Maf family nucleotide pyrophosphatase [Muribaculaceae bacterium]|nr:Maf family nucleotide pyrophosphatase [Muribaculaceae bacterium]
MLDNLSGKRIILASKSPRRRELLEMLDIDFECMTIDGIEEKYPENLEPERVPEYLAELKAAAYRKVIGKNDIVITADTVVISNGKILGKPANREEAVEMLLDLSGHTHKVVTGVSVTSTDRSHTFRCETEVTFDTITEEEVAYYVDKYRPFDKAGSYGIQEWIGCVAVAGINGSFYNVMGLPVNRLYHLLSSW